MLSESDGEEDFVVGGSPQSSVSRKRSGVESEEEEVGTETPLSSPHVRPSGAKRARLGTEDLESREGSVEAGVKDVRMADDDDEDDDVPVVRRQRGRAFGGFVVDSSDEE